jgi:hypothetical protein
VNAPSSERLIEALRQPGVLGDESIDVALLQTHISWVLLAGPCANPPKPPR